MFIKRDVTGGINPEPKTQVLLDVTETMSYKTQPFTCDTPSEFKETVSVTCRYNLNQFIKQST